MGAAWERHTMCDSACRERDYHQYFQQVTMEKTTGEKRGFLLAQVGSRSLSHLATVSEPSRLHIIFKWEDNFESQN